MKKISLRIFIAISLAILLTANTVTLHAKAAGVSQITEIKKDTEKRELITRTVKTQKELTTALKNASVDIIVIKPTKATTLTISKGNYQKDLVVYQAYTTLVNKATFKNSNIYVTSKAQLDKAVKVNGIDTITVKTDKKANLNSSKGNSKIALVVEAPNSNITNSSKWKSVTINDMNNSVWTEKGKNNNIVIKGNTNGIVINEKSTVKSLVVDQTKADTISIKVDGTVKKVTLKAATDIKLTGKNTTSFVNNITNETTKSIVINVNGKKVEVASKTKTPTPTVTEVPKPTETPVTTEPTETPSDPTAPTPTVPSHTHNYLGTVTTPATCNKDGIKTYTCAEDGNSYTEVIPATGHNSGEWEVIKAATYTSIGTKVQKCTVCGEILDTETIPVVAHTHNYVETSRTPATCTKDGIKIYTCAEDGNSYTEAILAIGHAPSEWITTKAATYTTTGTKVQKCTVCGETLTTETIPVVAHTHNYLGTVTTPATETSTGVKTYTCSLCENTYTETIPAVAHTHNYVETVTIPATCTVDGVKTYTCAVDGNSYIESISSTGHTLGTWITVNEATYTTTGEKVIKCTVCDEVIETEIIPIIAHSHEYSSEVTMPATETSTGIKTYTCNICNESYTEEIPMLENEIPGEPTNYTVEIDSTDGSTPSSVIGRDRLDLANEMFSKVNELRLSLGLSELTWDITLDDYTQLRAAEVTLKFSHTRPNGQHGYEMHDKITSENIAIGYETAEEAMTGFINSPSHYGAMINPDYDSIAIGCFEEAILDGNGIPTGEYYTGWVQFFHDNEWGLLIID